MILGKHAFGKKRFWKTLRCVCLALKRFCVSGRVPLASFDHWHVLTIGMCWPLACVPDPTHANGQHMPMVSTCQWSKETSNWPPWNPWNSMESMDSTEFHGIHGFHGFHRSCGFHGIPWIPWNQWNSIESMDSMEFHGFHGIHGSHGIPRNHGFHGIP